MADLWQRLQQRKLVQWALAYFAAAFALLQGVDIVAQRFAWPNAIERGLIIVVCCGFLVTLLLAWYHGERGAQKINGTELLLLALLLLVCAGLLWKFADSEPAPAAPPQASVASAVSTSVPVPAAGIPVKSVAVLPLANGGREGQQFFSDGLSESLIIALSQFDGLKVIGRNSSFQFRDTKDDSAIIGHKLGVAHLLEGSVQHAGDVVRISVELIDAASGQTRWSQHYDRPYKDLFKLQDEITNAVAGALQANLLSPNLAAQHSDRPPSGNIEAYNAFLQGLKHWHDEDFPKAAEDMTKAVLLDPSYAVAWAHLSGSWSTVAAFWNEPAAVGLEHMRESRRAADKALQLAPGLGAAHAASAYLQFYNFDYRGALDECHRAVQLAPRDGTVLNGCGFVLGGIGKLGEAIQLRERLLSTEPLYTINYFQSAKLLAAAGRVDDAEKYLRTGEEVGRPNRFEHLKLALLRGDANAAAQIARQASPHDSDLYLTLATQIGPDPAGADKWLTDLLADKTWVEYGGIGLIEDNRYKIALVYALRGDAGHTQEWLDRALAANPSRALFLIADPFLLRFRDDAWFIALCKKLGLPPPSESEALSIDQIRARLAAKG
jgi:TolB-like protein